jgi:hypothetical protein
MIQLNPACHKLLAEIHALESGPIPAGFRHHNISVHGDECDDFKHLVLAGYAHGVLSSNDDSDIGSFIAIRTTTDGRTYLSLHA